MSDNTSTVEGIIERLQDADNLPDSVHGKQLRTQEFGAGLKKFRVEIWERPPHKSRLELLSTEAVREFDSEPPFNTNLGGLENGGHVMVRNTGRLSKYNRDENRYQTYEVDNPEELSGSHIKPTLLGSSPLENFESTHEGTETVATRDTHLLSFQPKESANAFDQRYNYIQMWIDEEHWIPIKQDAEYRLEEETLRETKAFEGIEFDNVIEESIFRFDPPENAEIVD